MDDLIINFTPTGMVPTKDMTPHVPVLPNEIIEQVLEAESLGITIVHLHARDKFGKPTYRAEVYGRIIEGIRKHAAELIICASLSGRDVNEFEKRSEPLTLTGLAKPDMGSLTLSSMNFPGQASVNAPSMVQDLAAAMNEHGIIPELEVFDLGMINYAQYMIDRGMLKPPYYFNIIFGNIANAQANAIQAGLAVQNLPPGSDWSFGGIGNSQLFMNTVAVAMGGGVRVGLEDNLYFDRERRRLATNLELVRRVHELGELCGRRVMSSAKLREQWDVNEHPRIAC